MINNHQSLIESLCHKYGKRNVIKMVESLTSEDEIIPIRHREYYNGREEFFIICGSLEKFKNTYNKNITNAINNNLNKVDILLRGTFNEYMNNLNPKRLPKLQLYVRYHIDEERCDLIYLNEYEEYYALSEIDFFPLLVNI